MSSKLFNTQEIIMNNYVDKKCNNMDFIWDNINSSDSEIINKMSSFLINPYQQKLNLIYSLLYSNNSIPIKNFKDIINFFNFISPLNNEFLMGSYNWNIKIINDKNNIDDKKLFIQNSINKIDSCNLFYIKYINPIKKILDNSNIKFSYFEFKCNRFYKSKDIVWVFDKV
jgi:hypothetical protein